MGDRGGIVGGNAYGAEIIRTDDGMAAAISGRAITTKLHVHVDGDGSDGTTWAKSYTTIPAALNSASVDANDLTLILVAPGTYDINVTGNPTYAGNYIIQGSHRFWTLIKNDHGSATSIMKFTGLIGLQDLNFNLGTGNNGVIITESGFRVKRILFNGQSLTGTAKTALHIDGATTVKYGRIDDIDFAGNVTYMKGLLLDNASRNHVDNSHFHECLTAIQIVNAASDLNRFGTLEIGDNALGIDIDAGNEHLFNNIIFHHNDINIDDEVGDATWNNIQGEFDLKIVPALWAGVTVATGGAADAWTASVVEIVAAADSPHRPFKIVGYHLEANANEKFRIRFTADNGGTYFDEIMTEGETAAVQREALTKGSDTDHIFNKGTVIAAESMSESGGNSVLVWLEKQEI